MTARPKDLNRDFVKSLPDAGPVVMVNLVRFRESQLSCRLPAAGLSPHRPQLLPGARRRATASRRVPMRCWEADSM